MPKTFCARGFTLVEVVATIAIGSTIVMTLTSVQMYVSSNAAEVSSAGDRYQTSLQALHEIEQAIRMATEITQCSSGLLEVKTQYFLDADAAIESIQYTCDGTNLYRAIADGGATYAKATVLLSDVTAFEPRALEILEKFNRADYANLDAITWTNTDAVAKLGALASYDSLTKLSAVDSNVRDAINTDDQRLIVKPTDSAGTTLRISPALEKNGLHARTDFTPMSRNVDYYPLVYGDATTLTDAVAVHFESDGSIVVESYQSGKLIASDTMPGSWEVHTPYELRLDFQHGNVQLLVKKASEAFSASQRITSGSVDNEPLQLLASAAGSEAAWDNLVMNYPFVKVELTATIEGTSETLYGGAAKRR